MSYDVSNIIPRGGRGQALWLASMMSDIFGICIPVYIPYGKGEPAILPNYEPVGSADSFLPNYENIIFTESQQSEIKSKFGLPVFGTVTFKGGTYNQYDRYSGRIKQAMCAEYTLPYSCLIEFSRENAVITTNLLGNQGTVKELFGLGDWNISIKGIAVNGLDRVGNDAHTQIENLVAWHEINDAIGVGGSLFSSKGIDRIVIKSLNIQPIEAKYNVIPFTIEALSDEPLELQL